MPKIFGDESHTRLTELLQSTMRFDHPKMNDAFGLVWGRYRGMKNLWYEGGDAGFSSYMARFPAERFRVDRPVQFGAGDARGRALSILDLLVEPAASALS